MLKWFEKIVEIFGKKTLNHIIVIDTSVIEYSEGMKLIENASDVRIPYPVNQELNFLRCMTKDSGKFEALANIQRIFKAVASAPDKYYVEQAYKPNGNLPNDERIIKYTKSLGKSAILITGDIGQCSLCRAYGVQYHLLESTDIVATKRTEAVSPTYKLQNIGDNLIFEVVTGKYIVYNYIGDKKPTVGYKGRYKLDVYDYVIDISNSNSMIYYQAERTKGGKKILKRIDRVPGNIMKKIIK